MGTTEGGPRPGLRLAWANPASLERPTEPGPPRAELRLVPPPAIPPRRIKLDLAIERHLAGADGLSTEHFVLLFSGRVP